MLSCKLLRCIGGFLGLAGLSALVACGGGSMSGGGTPPPPPANVTVALSPKTFNVVAPQPLQFTATLTGDTQSQGVTWTVDSMAGGNANVGTISTGGLYTPPTSGGGAHTIVATSVADTTKSDSASINVTDLAGVFTYHNNVARDGTNTQEYILTTANVNQSTFGKLFSCAVDGQVYAQPLWVPNLTIGGVVHNVVFVATQHDTLYAFDADTGTQLWQTDLINRATSGETPVVWSDVGQGSKDIYPEVGVTGTPVIDPVSKTLYVVSKSEKTVSNFYQRLHAIDLSTGAEKFNGPVAIASAVTGDGDGSVGGVVTFYPRTHLQRPGLALVDGVVYISWASHEDKTPYHGWIIGYNATTLQQLSAYNTTANDGLGGIWMGGGAPAVDSAGNLYVATGNGGFDADSTVAPFDDVGDSILKLNPSGLLLSDYFTPFNQGSLESSDGDLGAGGVMLLPDQSAGPVPHLLVEGGKGGTLYLIDRDNMGHYRSTDNNQIVQSVALTKGTFSTPAFWQNNLFIVNNGLGVRSFAFNTATGLLATTVSSQSSTTFSFPAPSPSVSSQGASNGIVWAIDASKYAPKTDPPGPAVLHAYDATNLATELWNSSQAAGNRDQAGAAVKFTLPTVANGKVYVGTSTELTVYGLLP